MREYLVYERIKIIPRNEILTMVKLSSAFKGKLDYLSYKDLALIMGSLYQRFVYCKALQGNYHYRTIKEAWQALERELSPPRDKVACWILKKKKCERTLFDNYFLELVGYDKEDILGVFSRFSDKNSILISVKISKEIALKIDKSKVFHDYYNSLVIDNHVSEIASLNK